MERTARMTSPAPPDHRGLPTEQERLLAELRALRARTGLSLAALAAKSTFSKSSWERYLSGRAKTPRSAVETLCDLANEPPQVTLALWDLAAPTWQTTRPASSTTVHEALRADDVGPCKPGRRRWTVGVIAAALISAAVLLLLLLLTADPSPDLVRCHRDACNDRSPASSLCANQSVTLTSKHLPAGQVMEIRYSPQCETAWARIGTAHIGDQVHLNVPGGPTRTATVTDVLDSQSYVYTPMSAVHQGQPVTACVSQAHDITALCCSAPTPMSGTESVRQ
ncbi:DUF2690 domain-containing protein [Streptomyces sp. NPDC055897]